MVPALEQEVAGDDPITSLLVERLPADLHLAETIPFPGLDASVAVKVGALGCVGIKAIAGSGYLQDAVGPRAAQAEHLENCCTTHLQQQEAVREGHGGEQVFPPDRACWQVGAEAPGVLHCQVCTGESREQSVGHEIPQFGFALVGANECLVATADFLAEASSLLFQSLDKGSRLAGRGHDGAAQVSRGQRIWVATTAGLDSLVDQFPRGQDDGAVEVDATGPNDEVETTEHLSSRAIGEDEALLVATSQQGVCMPCDEYVKAACGQLCQQASHLTVRYTGNLWFCESLRRAAAGQVPQHDENLSPLCPQERQCFSKGGYRVSEAEVGHIASQGGLWGVDRGQADQTDADPLALEDRSRRNPLGPPFFLASVLSKLGDVGCQPVERRFPCGCLQGASAGVPFAVCVGAVIELVVAYGSGVYAEEPVGVDCTHALARIDRPVSLKQVAAIEKEQVRVGRAACIDSAVEPGEPAARVARSVGDRLFIQSAVKVIDGGDVQSGRADRSWLGWWLCGRASVAP